MAAFSPEGTRIVTAGADQTVHVWDAATGQELQRLPGNSTFSSARYSPDGGRILAADWGGSVHVWNAVTGEEVETLAAARPIRGPRSQLTVLTCSVLLRLAKTLTARLWDADTGQALLTLAGHTDTVNTAVFSPDGAYILTASGDGTARIWRTGNLDALMLEAES